MFDYNSLTAVQKYVHLHFSYNHNLGCFVLHW